MGVQGFSPSTTSNMNEHGVSLCTASRMDVQGVSFSTASGMDVQGVSPFLIQECQTVQYRNKGTQSGTGLRYRMPVCRCPAMGMDLISTVRIAYLWILFFVIPISVLDFCLLL